MMSSSIYSKFDIETLYADDSAGISIPSSIKYAVVGNDVDDRCKIVHDYLTSHYQIIEISYDADSFIVQYDGHEEEADDFPTFIRSKNYSENEILIDCTSVNVPELLLLLGALYESDVKQFSALYVEPKHYSQLLKLEIGSERKFELSNAYLGYKGIPGYLLSLDSGDYVAFCCGYEPERIMNAFDYESIGSKYATLIFGMPPFNAGWDMNAYENHISFIDSQSIRNVSYCGSTNPLAIIKKLDEMYQALREEEKLFVAPLGTKPMSLGACLFVVVSNDKERVALLFDHPVKKLGRSEDIGKWHLYNIEMP